MEAARVRVDLSGETRDRSYDILIRRGLLENLADGSQPLPDAASYVIVTDSNVGKLYGAKLQQGFSKRGKKADLLSFPAGETHKSLETAGELASNMSTLGAERGSLILALGGGVVGDLAGFVASIYKRGIGYVQLPTTLLAQVDSSIGGKTGVDTKWGKNQLGTFYQPLAVMSDTAALRTLPQGEIINGIAEIVKCGIIADKRIFDGVSRIADSLDSEVPAGLIIAAAKVKADVVSKDERELNLRAILNYGHTVGHAIESSSGYALSHGLSVLLGMIAEGWIARKMQIMPEDELERQNELLLRLIGPSRPQRLSLNERTLLGFAFADKKTTVSSLRMSLPERLGKMHATARGSYKIPVSDRDFAESVAYLRGVLRPLARGP